MISKDSLIKNESFNDSKIYRKLCQVPKGKITTYKLLGEAVGLKNSARFIGQVMAKNPNPIKVPCHRVISSNGELRGYALGLKKKKQLLTKEGIKIKNQKVSNFKDFLYQF